MRKIRTRALSLLLTLVMALGLLPGTAWAAENAVDDPVNISSAEELKAFRDRVNGGERTLSAVLTADIDLENEEWIPFNPQNGYVTSAYAGTFDGAGHTISGLSINDSSTNGVGLFGTVNSATIKNLKVEGTVSATKSGYVGGIVGKTNGTVTIERCSFSGSVQSSKTGVNAGAGGIIGRVNSGSVCVSGCANTADIRGGAAAGILG